MLSSLAKSSQKYRPVTRLDRITSGTEVNAKDTQKIQFTISTIPSNKLSLQSKQIKKISPIELNISVCPFGH